MRDATSHVHRKSTMVFMFYPKERQIRERNTTSKVDYTRSTISEMTVTCMRKKSRERNIPQYHSKRASHYSFLDLHCSEPNLPGPTTLISQASHHESQKRTSFRARSARPVYYPFPFHSASWPRASPLGAETHHAHTAPADPQGPRVSPQTRAPPCRTTQDR